MSPANTPTPMEIDTTRCRVARGTCAKCRDVRVTHTRTSTGPLSSSGYGGDDGISAHADRSNGTTEVFNRKDESGNLCL